jgi:hypothetical protein
VTDSFRVGAAPVGREHAAVRGLWRGRAAKHRTVCERCRHRNREHRDDAEDPRSVASTDV